MPDDPKIWVALVTSGLALIGTIYAAIMNHLSQSEQTRFKADAEKELARLEEQTNRELAALRAETDKQLARLNADLQTERDERLAQREAEKVVSKFRDPLLHAAYDFQSRIFNILKRGYLTRYLVNGSAREKEYAIENTMFLLAQFLGWTELIRQEVQFLDLGTEEQTRQLRDLQDRMYTLLHDDSLGTGFRLFPGEQRAVGELMIDRSREIPRCFGFAAFLKDRQPDIDHWLDPLRQEIKQMATDIRPFERRLTSIQHSLIDLLEFLDSDYVRFPAGSRSKI